MREFSYWLVGLLVLFLLIVVSGGCTSTIGPSKKFSSPSLYGNERIETLHQGKGVGAASW